MNIYIIIEMKDREFLSRLLTGAESALNGNDVYIGDKEISGLILQNKLKPGIIFLKSITPNTRRLLQLKHYKNKEFIVTSIDEEGGLVHISFKDFVQRRYSAKTLSYTDTVFCFGEFDYKNYKKIFVKYKEKFLLSGNPRFDLLNNKIANNFVEKQNSNKIKIVIISSFTIFGRKIPVSDHFLINDEFHEDYYYDTFAHRAVMSVNYIKLLKKIISNFPNIEIDIWLHPVESINNWKKALPNNKNIKFTTGTKFLTKNKKDKTIFIHSGSGLAFNAILQEKIVISYQPINSKWNNTHPNNNSIIMKSDREIIEFIKKKKFKKIKINKKKLQNCHKIISNSKTYDASFKIASHWEKFKNQKLSQKNDFLKLTIKNKLKFVKQKLNLSVENKKFSPITSMELKKYKNILIKTNPKFKMLNFSLIGPRLINIKKNNI
mgnify:CR=1 FL=1